MPDDDEPDHRRSATAPAYPDPDSDLDSDLDSIPPQPRSPSHPPLPSLTTTTATTGSPVRSTSQTSPKGKGLRSPLGFGSPPQGSSSRNVQQQVISHPSYPRPQTPPNNPQRAQNRHGLHRHGSRSPSPSPSPRHLPPPAAASTLYHLVGGLGLGPSSPLSPFRRQFSASLQAVRSSSRAPSFASIAGSRPSTSYGSGSGTGTFFTHVNDSHGTVHHLAIKDDDHNLSFHEADDELSDDDQHPPVRVDTAAAANKTEENDHDNLTQGSKDMLVERLTDLIHYLQETKDDQTTATNQSGVLSDVSISELHAKVDEMEAVLTGKGTGTAVGDALRTMKRPPVGPSARVPRRGGQRQDENENENESDGDEEDEEHDQEKQPHSPLKDMLAFASSAAAAAAPGWLARSFSGSEPSQPESRAHSPSPSSKVHLKLAEAAEIKPSAVGAAGTAAVSVAEVEVDVEVEAKKRWDVVETERIAGEAEKLAAQLEAVLKSLETRREESNHVHALLVERAEAAASRILDLEKEVVYLEEEISSQESELKHLRLELRAIETLVNEFLPPVEAADPELVRSIENWKADWKKLREQMLLSKSRRKGKSSNRKIPEEHDGGHDGHDGHEEGRRQINGKERNQQHGHEDHAEEEAYAHARETHETHETHELSVVMEVMEESVRQGHPQQHQQQHFRNGNGVGGGDADGQGDDAMATSASPAPTIAPAHAVRVSRTGA
ncbi:hypothetical protein SMACR_06750 [Sordaria macrospora]|uniref:Uncharacterized protein n=1 Tax=Sordaria macrospora TaxID=5147 RepID=A0A8S8ZR92_SORMA|nr:hypothetical protein SMACR_06750 [Sordaria macrospora]WPJ64942.1 hypothetical protein SMAC4_06750 [Sordaria macrospora]